MFSNQILQIKSVLPKFTESQISYGLHRYHGDINQTITELLSNSPPKIENNVIGWFDYFDPSRIGLDQDDIIHALELTYGSNIREFDFASSVRTMWPTDIPASIKISRDVFAEPGEGMGIGIAEYARNLSPIINDVTNLAKVLSPQISHQLIYDTLKSCKFDKFSTLKKLHSTSQNSQFDASLPIYQASAIQLFPPSQPPGTLHQPSMTLLPPTPSTASKCSKCYKPIQNGGMGTFLCDACRNPTYYSPPNSGTQATILQPPLVSSHSGYRPPAGISPAIDAPPMSPIHPKRNRIVKKALLIGINYHGQRGQLRGCCNDVCEIYKLLTKTYQWDPSEFRILSDEDLHLQNQLSTSRSRETKPTKKNILKQMQWLSSDVLPGDALFFHYSGHGAQQPDPNGIESDGMNETILPVDYQTEGMITDDEISSILIQTLPDGVRLTCIMDSCHSGTGCDLPYTWNPRSRKFEIEPNPYFSLGDVILFSGCQDSATSCDVSSAFSAPGGAMTTAFTKALKRNPFPTYDELLDLLLQEMKSNGFDQRPQMSSTQEFEIGRPFSMIEALPNTNTTIGRTITERFHSRPRATTPGDIGGILFNILGLLA